jgi:hypothetical protein
MSQIVTLDYIHSLNYIRKFSVRVYTSVGIGVVVALMSCRRHVCARVALLGVAAISTVSRRC